MRDTGVIDTKGTENIEIDERSGTHGGTSVSAMAPELHYLDHGVPSQAIAIEVKPEEAEHAAISDAVITRPLPFERVRATSDLITRTGPWARSSLA